MRAHLLTLAACVAIASAVGCTRGENNHSAAYPKAPAAPQMQPSVATAEGQSSELNRATRPEDHAATRSQPLQGPVTITGLMPYAERFDPSGWSGSSTPKATGGGPPPEATDIPAGNQVVGAEQGLAPSPGTQSLTPTPAPSTGNELTPDEKPQPPKPPAKNDDLIDEYK